MCVGTPYETDHVSHPATVCVCVCVWKGMVGKSRESKLEMYLMAQTFLTIKKLQTVC